MKNDERPALLLAGLALGLGVGLAMRKRRRRQEQAKVALPVETHWSAMERFASAAIGGGLMYYGTRGPNKLHRIAAMAGAGLLLHGINDEPIRSFSDVLPARALLMG